MTALYDTRLVIASLANVPTQGYGIAHENGRRIFAQSPNLLVLTETWDGRVKQGLRDAAPHTWAWHTTPGQSVMIGWDTTTWARGIPSAREGACSPRIPLVCDRRDLIFANLRRAGSKRRLVLGGVHTCPIPTRKAPWKVPAAKAAHALARRRLTRFENRIGYPVVLAGDWNVTTLLNPDLRIGPGITHVEAFDGINAAFGPAKARTFGLHSDHPGVVVDLRLVAA